MKKLLGIVVLGLLLSGCANGVSDLQITQLEHMQSKVIKIGMTYEEFDKIFKGQFNAGTRVNGNNNKTPKYIWVYSNNNDISSISYAFESGTNVQSDSLLNDFNSYKLTEIFFNHLDATEYYLNLKPSDPEEIITLMNSKRKIANKIAKKKAKKMKKYKARIKKKTEEFEKIKEEENRSSNVLDKNIAKPRSLKVFS